MRTFINAVITEELLHEVNVLFVYRGYKARFERIFCGIVNHIFQKNWKIKGVVTWEKQCCMMKNWKVAWGEKNWCIPDTWVIFLHY